MQALRFFSVSSFILFAVFFYSNTQVIAGCPEDLLNRAEQGDYNAQCYIGHLYLSGKDVPQDFSKARYWYQRVINQQSADAQIVAHANLVLGMLYKNGKGGKQSYEDAMHCFQLAAQQGYTDAHINIGLLYAKGLGTKRDLQKALYWWQQAAEKGHPTAPGYVRQLKQKIGTEG